MSVSEVPTESEIEQHFGLVHFALKRYAQRGLQRADWEDLLQVGKIGLLKAIRNFDPSKGYSFSTFAVSCIKWEAWAHLRNLKDLRRVRQFHFLSLERSLTDEGDSSFRNIISADDDVTAVMVDEFLQRLPKREKTLVLYRLRGATQSEVAKRLGLSQAHVSRLLQKVGRKYLEYLRGGD